MRYADKPVSYPPFSHYVIVLIGRIVWINRLVPFRLEIVAKLCHYQSISGQANIKNGS